MIRRFLFLMLLLCSAAGHAQQPSGAAADSSMIVKEVRSFQLETGRAFFSWEVKPDSISFMLFDRWGTPVARSVNPDFKMDDALLLKNEQLHMSDTYIYVLRVYYAGKPEQVYRVAVVYAGRYCSG